MRALLAGIAALALGGCATTAATGGADDAAELERALAGRVAGTPQKCVQLTRLDGPMIYGETILYRDGSRLWRTQAVDGCPGLRGDPILVVESIGGQLCNNDRFRIMLRQAPSIPGPYCRFGDFTPYTRPKG